MGVKLLGHEVSPSSQLVPSLRMNGVVPLLPLYAFMAQTGKNLPFLPFMTFIKDVF